MSDVQLRVPGMATDQVQEYEIAHAGLARRAAADGFVLLKNDGLLPLPTGTKLALYGSGASNTVKGGTGSGDVNPRYVVSVWEGLKAAGYDITTEAWLTEYRRRYQQARLMWRDAIRAKQKRIDPRAGRPISFFEAYSSQAFQAPVGAPVGKTRADTALYVLSRVAGEGADRGLRPGDYYLSAHEEKDIDDLCALYGNVVLVMNVASAMDLSFLDTHPRIRAALLIGQPGMEGGSAFADILSGQTAPSGKLTDTWPLRYEDFPYAMEYSSLNGDVTRERYREGVYVGYRWFDTCGVPVRYGFGYGLSYTAFDIAPSDIRVAPEGSVTVTASVTNTGRDFSGREIVQLYASLPMDSGLEHEYRRLCAFQKTPLLAPRQSAEVALTFGVEDLASFDPRKGAWVLDQGAYGLFVGGSLADSRPAYSLSVPALKTLRRVPRVCPIQEALDEAQIDAGRRECLKASLDEALRGVRTIRYDPAVEPRAKAPAAADPLLEKARALVESLTPDELVLLAIGDPSKGQDSVVGSAGVTVPGAAAETSSCAQKHGIRSVALADGPAGLRLNRECWVANGRALPLPFEASIEQGLFADGPKPEGEKRYQYCTAFPTGAGLAQTWDVDLLQSVGSAVADEMKRFGVTLWLAPGMNIHRNPLCGRNFEYYSEDPLISGEMAAAITLGVQRAGGCGTTIKHFACNNQEDNRMRSDSVVSERALREIYLRGFGIAIRKAQPLALMTSYNLVNGVHAANSRDLCTEIARSEFGFGGLIMTDWSTTEQGPDCTAAGCVSAGNDLVMPGKPSDQQSIRQALADGALSLAELKDCITRVVYLVLRTDAK